MINLALFLPITLGVTVVIQATLNRIIGLQYGLATAVTINAAVLFILSLGFFYFVKYTPSLVPEFLQIRSSEKPFSWIFLIPGLCGFFLVLGLPWSIQIIGPSTTFLLLIASQIFVSLTMEVFQSSHWPSFLKILGAIFVLLGSIFVVKG